MKITRKKLVELINEEVHNFHKKQGLLEKAKSKQQQKFMGMVHALQKGEMESGKASKELKKTAATMSPKDVEDFASTKHKGLPTKVEEDNQGADEHKKMSKSKKKHSNGIGDFWSSSNGDSGDGGDGGGMAENIVEEIYNIFTEAIEEEL